jgi:hypothetical protein
MARGRNPSGGPERVLFCRALQTDVHASGASEEG